MPEASGELRQKLLHAVHTSITLAPVALDVEDHRGNVVIHAARRTFSASSDIGDVGELDRRAVLYHGSRRGNPRPSQLIVGVDV